MNYSLAITIIVALMLSACLKESEVSKAIAGESTANQKPIISGVPPTDIRAGLAYEFTPVASDPDGDELKFRISNKPDWAQFDPASGRLSGMPQEADVGIIAEIRISVTDGQHFAGLPRFSIAVNQISTGSVTLSWHPPTLNSDGSALTDLAGYRVYYGRQADILDQMITVDNAGLTAIEIENLSPATWHFAMTSYNSNGVEGARSSTVSKTVS